MAKRQQDEEDPSNSTLALFSTILQKAEADFISSTTKLKDTNTNRINPSNTQIDSGTNGQHGEGAARARLFHIATQLARLNLQDELLPVQQGHRQATRGYHHPQEAAIVENAGRLWKLILSFMERYPDYALFKIILPSAQHKQTGKTRQIDGNDNDQEQEEEEDETEDISIWLLPRLLRCIILSSTSASLSSNQKEKVNRGATPTKASSFTTRTTTTTAVAAKAGEERDVREEVVDNGEQWITNLIINHLRLFYHREEGGLSKAREIVKSLIRLAQDASALYNNSQSSDISFPTKLYIFQPRIYIRDDARISSNTAVEDRDFFAVRDQQQQGQQGGSTNTTAAAERNDSRPFHITIDSSIQAQYLQLSITRILLFIISISEQWTFEYIPEIMELPIGTEEEWKLNFNTRKKWDNLEWINILTQRVRCVMEVYKLSERTPLPSSSLRAMFLRVIDLAISPQWIQNRQSEEDDEIDGSHSSIARLEEAIFLTSSTLIGRICKRENTPFDFIDIARRYRRAFIDVLYSENASTKQHKQTNMQGDGGIDLESEVRNITHRELFCLNMLSLGAPVSRSSEGAEAPKAVLREITNAATMKNREISKRTDEASRSVYAFEEKDSTDILEWIDSFETPPSLNNGASAESQRIVKATLEQTRKRVQIDLASKSKTDALRNEGRKRKTAPGIAETDKEEEAMSARADRTCEILKEFYSAEMATAVSGSVSRWEGPVTDFLLQVAASKDGLLEERHFEAIEKLTCRVPMEMLDHSDVPEQVCKLCTRRFVMAELPTHDLEDTSTHCPELFQALKTSYPKLNKSAPAVRVAFWRAVSALLGHSGEQTYSLYPWLDLIAQDLKHQNRLARLAAGYAGNMIIAELYRHNPRLDTQGQLSNYFTTLESLLKASKASVRLTTVTVVADLIRIASSAILGKALSLAILALAAQGQLRAIFTAQLDSIFKTREVAPYKFFSPYLHQLCPVIARNLDSSFTLLYTFTDLLRTTLQSFLQTPDIARIFLAEAILNKREDIIQVLAECAEVSQAEFLVLNADCCFAPLYFTTISKFEDCRNFYMGILQAQSFKTTFQQLLEGDLPAVLLEVLIRADPEKSQQLDTIIQRIFRDLRNGQSLSIKEANTLLGRSGTVLAVFGRAGDSLRGMYGKKSPEERAMLLQGMEILVTRVQQLVSGAAPQIMTILQTSFKDPEIRLPALRLWKRFLETLRIDEVKPLIAQSTAVFIQAWPELQTGEKTLVKQILHYFLVDQYKNLEDALPGVADMSTIPELDTFQKRLLARREGQSSEDRIKAYLRRLDTVNEATLVQTLRELLQFLKTESATIHKLAAGSSFSPLLGETIHTLLSTAIRSSEAKSIARPLALQCLGVLGALDPDRMTFPPEESAFVIEHDLRTPDECMRFAMYTIEKILLRVLRTTNDPQQQTALYLAIQGLAAVCGFDETLRSGNTFRQGVDATIRQRWNSLPRHVQDVVEPLISASIKVESSIKPEKPEYPLFRHRSSYREWLQTWTSDLIDHLVQGHSSINTIHSPAKLFGPLRAAVRRGHDLTVPHYILPFLIFFTVTSGNTTQTNNISREIQQVLQDQIAPSSDIAMPSDSRSLCAQAVFELMDKLNTWRRARLVYVTKRYKRRDTETEIDAQLFYTKKIDALFSSLPQNMVADAAFNAKSHARALLNYERILYGLGSKKPVSQLQNYYERLHNIYAELNEPDGMEGVSVSIISPSLEHQIREHEMTGRWTSAQSCWEVQLQLEPENPASHLGLLRCLRNLGHYGLQVEHANWQDVLSPYELESALISGDAEAISSALQHANPSCPEAAFARVMLASKESPNAPPATAFLEAAESLGSAITTASKDSYHRFYDTVVKLHMLHEVETLFMQSTVGGAAHRQQSKADQANFAARLELTSPAFSTREAILNMRRNTYRLCGAEAHTNDIGPLWLMTSKIAIKAQHLQTAYSAILQANQLKAEFAFMQSAKLYHTNDHLHRALQEIEQGLKLLGALDTNSTNRPSYDPTMMKKLAKATVRSARWMQETGRFEHLEIVNRYHRAVKLCPEWEAAYYRLGQYADDCIQASPPFERKPNGEAQTRANTALLSNMEICVHYFSRALRFGAKFIYQALPRMVTIWLDMGAWPDIAVLPAEAFIPGSSSATAANATKMRKIEQMKQNQSPAVKAATDAFEKIYVHIRRSLDKLAPYMWLSVLPQLVSRINHDSPAVYAQLVYLIERVIQHYPQQAIWTMLGVLYSANTARRERCTQILKRAQANPPAGAGAGLNNQRQALTATVRTLQELVRCFLEMAGMKIEGSGTLSMAQTFPALKAMVPCDIIIPLQNAMTITLPTDEKVFAHKPFPSDLVTFHGFKDEVDVMASVAKPRKIVIIGSDGQSYRFLCKPLDDLRKDNRFNECTALIGKLLMKDPDARKRGLCIRTYAVIPLSEQCGLIEWVPDTAGIRNLFIGCYEPRGISVWNDHLKKVYESLKGAQKTDPAKCGQAFTQQILTSIPPIFHEWFMSNFPEPTAWLKARTNYGRTAAVMSMVGFVLGLGDRHGENILIDTTNGDVVHVDFNCLFGMGQVHFDIAEKVPFRLTQNVIDGFGITGVEGVFRKCCEITLRILRENRNSLMSVLESFVHDPLLDLQLTRGGKVERKNIGAARNETKEQKARREEEQRKSEARTALSYISNKLKGTQSTTLAEKSNSDIVSTVEMTVETLFREATDPKNLGGMYCGWAAWL